MLGEGEHPGARMLKAARRGACGFSRVERSSAETQRVGVLVLPRQSVTEQFSRGAGLLPTLSAGLMLFPGRPMTLAAAALDKGAASAKMETPPLQLPL